METKPQRNLALDAYRGFVMLLMMAEVLQFARVAHNFPGNWFWGVLAFNQTHVAWAGCSLHDLIQPSFSFLVGAALPYSIASRMAKGKTFGPLFGHAVWRSFLLVALGVGLRSLHSSQTNITFEDTLAQIGLGYPLLFLLGFARPQWQWIALAAILVGYWLAWAAYPVPGTGFEAHWAKNSNFGASFDRWFLNLFPHSRPFLDNSGGYLTLSFIPTLGTMILGLAAGRWLRAEAPQIPMRKLVAAGVIGLAAGALLHFAGICPVVKRIWTPSWVLFSGGSCFLLVAAFSLVLDVWRYRNWAFPLVVIGMNSIAAYLMAELFGGFVFGPFSGATRGAFDAVSTALRPLLQGAVVLAMYWMVLFWMYRRKAFLRI